MSSLLDFTQNVFDDLVARVEFVHYIFNIYFFKCLLFVYFRMYEQNMR